MKEQFDAVLAAIDAETTRIADYISALLGKLTAGGLTKAEEQEILNEATVKLDRLRAIGAVVDGEVNTGDSNLPVPSDEGSGDSGTGDTAAPDA